MKKSLFDLALDMFFTELKLYHWKFPFGPKYLQMIKLLDQRSNVVLTQTNSASRVRVRRYQNFHL